SRTSHATPFRTVAFNDNAAGHGWTLPVPTPRPDFDKPVPAESSLTTVTVVLRITTASPTGDEECQHCHGQHADREPLTSFKVEAEDHSGERTGKQTGSDGVQQPSEFSPPRLRLSLTGARAPPQTDLANEHHEETDNPHTCRAEDERAGPLSEIDHCHGREHAQPQHGAKDRQELPRRFVLLAAALTRLTTGLGFAEENQRGQAGNPCAYHAELKPFSFSEITADHQGRDRDNAKKQEDPDHAQEFPKAHQSHPDTSVSSERDALKSGEFWF